jgi:hypothetical protein
MTIAYSRLGEGGKRTYAEDGDERREVLHLWNSGAINQRSQVTTIDPERRGFALN